SADAPRPCPPPHPLSWAFGGSGPSYRPGSSVTTILANVVGRSVVSATPQPPASGPLALVTTPPRSLSPIRTASAVFCWAHSQAGAAIHSTAMLTASRPKYNPLDVLMSPLLSSLPTAPCLRRDSSTSVYAIQYMWLRLRSSKC